MRSSLTIQPRALSPSARLALVGVVATFLGASACNRGTKRSCSDRVSTMRAALAPIAADTELRARLGPVALIAAPPGATTSTPLATAVLSVDERGVYYDGAALDAPLSDLPRARTAIRERLRAGDPQTLGLAIDRGAPWPAVVDVVALGLRGRDRVELLVTGVDDPELAALPLAERLADAPPDEGLGIAMRAATDAIGGCTPAKGVFARLADANPSARFDPRALADAVERCDCAADVERLTEVIRVLTSPSPPLVAITLSPGGEPLEVSGVEADTWSARGDELLRAAPNARPRVPPQPEPVPDEPLPEPEPIPDEAAP